MTDHDTPLKAYKLEWDDYEGRCEVVFARTANEARRHCPDFCDASYIERKATRAPEFDHCTPPLTARDYIDAGWSYSCAGYCERQLDADGELDAAEDGNPYYTDVHGNIFCGSKCADDRYRDIGRQKGLKLGAMLDALDRWPGIAICGGCGIGNPGGSKHKHPVGYTWFRFPGGEHLVTWERGDDHVQMMSSDAEAWGEFVTAIKHGRRAA